MLWVMTGIITLSSSWPASAASATVVSRPSAWKQTWFTISAIEGFTLPGMMLDPGCTAGSTISASPVRGPDASSRMSLAILLRSSTYARNAPLSVATSPMRLHELDPVLPFAQRRARSPARRYFTISAGYSGSALMPVPTAVPPMFISRSQSAACASFSPVALHRVAVGA